MGRHLQCAFIAFTISAFILSGCASEPENRWRGAPSSARPDVLGTESPSDSAGSLEEATGAYAEGVDSSAPINTSATTLQHTAVPQLADSPTQYIEEVIEWSLKPRGGAMASSCYTTAVLSSLSLERRQTVAEALSQAALTDGMPPEAFTQHETEVLTRIAVRCLERWPERGYLVIDIAGGLNELGDLPDEDKRRIAARSAECAESLLAEEQFSLALAATGLLASQRAESVAASRWVAACGGAWLEALNVSEMVRVGLSLPAAECMAVSETHEPAAFLDGFTPSEGYLAVTARGLQSRGEGCPLNEFDLQLMAMLSWQSDFDPSP